MKKQDWLIPVAMLALGAGIGFLADHRPKATAGSEPVARTDGTTPTAQPVAISAVAAPRANPRSSPTDMAMASPRQRIAASTSAALPADDAMVVDSIAALRDRALAGDAVAACRLAVDLMLCDWWQPTPDAAVVDRIDPAKAKSTEDLHGMEWQLKRLAAGQQRARRCAGVTDAQMRESGRWLRAAARAGHVPSMHAYASTTGVPNNKFLSRLDELAIFRDEAAPMIEAAARGGSVAAVMTLGMTLDQSWAEPFLGEAFATRQNPVEALSYRLLFAMALEPSEPEKSQSVEQLLGERREGALKAGKLTPAQIADAEQLARERFGDWFGGRRAPIQTMDMMPFGFETDRKRPTNTVCTEGPWTTPPVIPARSSG